MLLVGIALLIAAPIRSKEITSIRDGAIQSEQEFFRQNPDADQSKFAEKRSTLRKLMDFCVRAGSTQYYTEGIASLVAGVVLLLVRRRMSLRSVDALEAPRHQRK